MHPLFPLLKRIIALPDLRLAADPAAQAAKLRHISALVTSINHLNQLTDSEFLYIARKKIAAKCIDPDFSANDRANILHYLQAWFDFGNKCLSYNAALYRIGRDILKKEINCDLLLPLTITLLPNDPALLTALKEKTNTAIDAVQIGEMAFYVLQIHLAIEAKLTNTEADIPVDPDLAKMVEAMEYFINVEILKNLNLVKTSVCAYLNEIEQKIEREVMACSDACHHYYYLNGHHDTAIGLILTDLHSPLADNHMHLNVAMLSPLLEKYEILVNDIIPTLERTKKSPLETLTEFAEKFFVYFENDAVFKIQQHVKGGFFASLRFFISQETAEEAFLRKSYPVASMAREQEYIFQATSNKRSLANQ